MAHKFAVVTIAFNNIQGLSRTISSLDRQSESSWQHVIIDGGSTDGTVEMLRLLPPALGRRWISEPDSGIYDAMNKGLRYASGELVFMLNSGDSLVEASTLSKIWDDYVENRWDWAYGAVRFVNSMGEAKRLYSFCPFNRERFISGLSWIPHSTVVMTSALIARVGTYRTDLGTAADQDYLMRAMRIFRPRAIPWLVSDYEEGGISSAMGPRDRELCWHRLRRENDYLFGDSVLFDRIISESLALRSLPKIAAKKMLRHRMDFK